MPAVSRKQFKLFKAAEHGPTKAKGLSKAKAKEMTAGQSPKGLPARKRRKKKG
jgi:hypothetical protein